MFIDNIKEPINLTATNGPMNQKQNTTNWMCYKQSF